MKSRKRKRRSCSTQHLPWGREGRALRRSMQRLILMLRVMSCLLSQCYDIMRYIVLNYHIGFQREEKRGASIRCRHRARLHRQSRARVRINTTNRLLACGAKLMQLQQRYFWLHQLTVKLSTLSRLDSIVVNVTIPPFLPLSTQPEEILKRLILGISKISRLRRSNYLIFLILFIVDLLSSKNLNNLHLQLFATL